MNGTTLPSLVWGMRLDAAIALAGEIHRAQCRKGTTIAYVAHLFDVASLVIKHGGGEDEVVAAFLHDALEDGDRPAEIRRVIRATFGESVLAIVTACTDTTRKKKPAWRRRKARYIASIAKKSPSAKLVSACDKVANVSDMIEDYARVGDDLWSRFKVGREEILWYQNSCAREFGKGEGVRRLQPVLRLLRSRIQTLSDMSEPRRADVS